MWNYAQAIPHLFPMLERSFRNAEFHEDQNEEGHQEFRSALPIASRATPSTPLPTGSWGAL